MADVDARAREALANQVQRRNLARFAAAWRQSRDTQLPPERFHSLRDELRAARRRVVDDLPDYVERFRRAAERAGARVYVAATAEDANRYVVRLAQERGVRLAVKSKSMVSEETGLNRALEAAGVEPVETDLGEWIIQLARERPSHMVMPAIHKDRRQAADLLSAATGREVDRRDIPAQVAEARRALRERFLAAGMGITGANALIAETGTIVLVTNEGNGRLVTTAPPLHVAVVGMEKIVPTFEDAVTMLRLLPRSATAQTITSYVTFITGPSAPDRELHIVLVDNGRRELRAHPDFRDALLCIRCGACANICPPYGVVGGHVFGGPTYTGAIGLVASPFHHGLDSVAGAQSLCAACNACETVCPVGIPLPALIQDVREQTVRLRGLPWLKRRALALYASPRLFDLATRAAAKLQRPFVRDGFVRRLPGLGRLTRWRSLPALAPRPARDLLAGRPSPPGTPLVPSAVAGRTVAYFPGCLTDRFAPEVAVAAVRVLEALGCRVVFPADQHCCGLPAANSGDRLHAVQMAKQTIRALERESADYVLSTASSCAVAMLQDYPRLFRHDARWRARAERLAARVVDFTTFLAREARIPAGALAARSPRAVAYHDACQSVNCLDLRQEPRRLIREVLGLELRELSRSDACCGFGGSFSFEHPEVSAAILEEKLANLAATGADTVVLDNAGCLLHLRGGLHAARSKVRAVHLAELVAECLPPASPPPPGRPLSS